MCEADKGSILIFKGDDDSNTEQDPYVLELKKLKFNCKVIAALKFEFTNSEVLYEKLSHPELYSGIIFSSPRCVEAVKRCNNLKDWCNHVILCVGSKTAGLVKELGVKPLGEDCGNAQALSEFILKDYSYLQLPLLLPHGNISLKTLDSTLTTGGVKIDSVEVYTTLPNPAVEESIKNYFEQSSKVDFTVYMSPSAVSASLPSLGKYQELSTIKFITLGPTTANSLVSNGITPVGVAEKPTPQHLAQLFSKLLPNKS